MSARGAHSGRAKAAWAALALPPLAWMSFEYGSAGFLRGACEAVGGWLGWSWAAGALLACAGAAVLAGRARGREAAGAGGWLGRVALGAAGIFALAIALQFLAILIVPPCAR